MISAMAYQLMRNASLDELEVAGLGANYTEHGYGIFPTDASGVPFSVGGMGSTGDALADLSEDMAAEQKARTTYEHLINLTNDPDVLKPLHYLRQREIVHYQRFKELFEEYKKEGF